MNRSLAMFATLFLAAGCSTESPTPEQGGQKPAAATTVPNASLPKRVEPVALACGPKGTKAEYHAQTRSMPPTVDLSFSGSRPTSQVAERVLRKCLQEVADGKFVSVEVLGTIWYSRSGSDDDATTVALPDGSEHLVFRADTKRIITWKQREGGPSDVVKENVAGGYFVRSETNKVLVPPYGSFISLSVVFKKEGTEKQAFEVLIAEVKKAVSAQAKPVSTTAYAMVGPSNDPAAQHQVKGSSGQFISVEFDPKRGPDVLTTSAGTSERLK